jgi:hypothetical protein
VRRSGVNLNAAECPTTTDAKLSASSASENVLVLTCVHEMGLDYVRSLPTFSHNLERVDPGALWGLCRDKHEKFPMEMGVRKVTRGHRSCQRLVAG